MPNTFLIKYMHCQCHVSQNSKIDIAPIDPFPFGGCDTERVLLGLCFHNVDNGSVTLEPGIIIEEALHLNNGYLTFEHVIIEEALHLTMVT